MADDEHVWIRADAIWPALQRVLEDIVAADIELHGDDRSKSFAWDVRANMKLILDDEGMLK